ncbi:MAG TPA: hypothetical protein VIK20_00880 [Bacteroidales bacterium]
MRKSIFYLLFSLISSVAMAAESDSSVVFKASFLKNELQSYEISRALYTIHKGDTTSLEKLGFQADVYVKDSTENYYLLTWRFSKFRINTDNLKLRQLIALAKPVEISYRITKPGVLIDFLNGEKVSTCLEEALPQVLSSFANQKGTENKVEVASIYDMRETVETLMLRAITQFHQAYGLGYTLGEIVDVPTVVNSQFTTKPINGIIRKKLIRIDAENHFAILSTATFLDNKEFRKGFKDYMKIDSIPDSSINQENMGSVIMDLTTGWVLWTFDQRDTRLGNDIYGELIEIKHMDDMPQITK